MPLRGGGASRGGTGGLGLFNIMLNLMHSPYTIYAWAMPYLYTIYAPSMPLRDGRDTRDEGGSLCLIPALSLPCPCPVHSPVAPSIHLPCCIYAVSTLYLYCIYTVSILYLYCIYTVSILYLYCIYTPSTPVHSPSMLRL